MNIGWLTGFEPATTATTTQRSTELSYSHHEAALTIGVRGGVGDVAHRTQTGIKLNGGSDPKLDAGFRGSRPESSRCGRLAGEE